MSERVPRKERSRQLLDIGLRMVVEDGYGSLTMSSIAREAGISKPIVYRSFPNRAALLGAMLRREQKRTDRVLDEAIPTEPDGRHPREVLTSVVDVIMASVEKDPNTWRLVLLPPEGTPRLVRELVERRRNAMLSRARILVRWGVAYLDGGDERDVEIISRILLSIVQNQATLMLTQPDVGRGDVVAMTSGIIGSVGWLDAPTGS